MSEIPARPIRLEGLRGMSPKSSRDDSRQSARALSLQARVRGGTTEIAPRAAAGDKAPRAGPEDTWRRLTASLLDSPRSGGLAISKDLRATGRGATLRPHPYSRTAPETSGGPADSQRSHSFAARAPRGPQAAKPLQRRHSSTSGVADVNGARAARNEDRRSRSHVQHGRGPRRLAAQVW